MPNVVGILSVAVMLQAPTPSSTESVVHLRQLRTIPLPSNFAPSGVSQVRDAIYVLDSANGAVLVARSETSQIVRHDSLVSAIAVGETEAGLEVLRAASVVRITDSGDVARSKPIGNSDARAIAGTMLDNHWTYVLQSGRGTTVDCYDGAYRTQLPIEASEFRVVATTVGGSMYLVLDEVPFPIFEVVIGSCVAREVAPRSVAPGGAVGFSPHWRAVSVARVGDEIWVSLANLANDQRVVAVVGIDGTSKRSQSLSVPFAVLGTLGEEVVALRRLNTAELVLYEHTINPAPRR